MKTKYKIIPGSRCLELRTGCIAELGMCLEIKVFFMDRV